MEEVKTNLQNLCRFDRPRIEKLFYGGSTTLKSGLAEPEANRYKAALDRADKPGTGPELNCINR